MWFWLYSSQNQSNLFINYNYEVGTHKIVLSEYLGNMNDKQSEIVQYKMAGCKMQAATAYIDRHNQVAGIVSGTFAQCMD